MFLADTNVLSAGAPDRAAMAAVLAGWMERNRQRVFISVVTIAEIEGGIARLRRLGSLGRADRLSAWLSGVLRDYCQRILPIDVKIARSIGTLSERLRAEGRHPGFPDVAIAATAQTHEFTILTRNTRHFQGLGLTVADPFE